MAEKKKSNVTILKEMYSKILEGMKNYNDTNDIMRKVKDRLESFEDNIKCELDKVVTDVRSISEQVIIHKVTMFGNNGTPGGLIQKTNMLEADLASVMKWQRTHDESGAYNRGREIGLIKGVEKVIDKKKVEIEKWKVIVLVITAVITAILGPVIVALVTGGGP